MTRQPDLSAGTCTTVIGFAEASVYEQAQVCRGGCPVLVECLEFGIATPPDLRVPGIVFGGLTERKLENIRRRRRAA
jgi:hypothetical protein